MRFINTFIAATAVPTLAVATLHPAISEESVVASTADETEKSESKIRTTEEPVVLSSTEDSATLAVVADESETTKEPVLAHAHRASLSHADSTDNLATTEHVTATEVPVASSHSAVESATTEESIVVSTTEEPVTATKLHTIEEVIMTSTTEEPMDTTYSANTEESIRSSSTIFTVGEEAAPKEGVYVAHVSTTTCLIKVASSTEIVMSVAVEDPENMEEKLTRVVMSYKMIDDDIIQVFDNDRTVETDKETVMQTMKTAAHLGECDEFVLFNDATCNRISIGGCILERDQCTVKLPLSASVLVIAAPSVNKDDETKIQV